MRATRFSLENDRVFYKGRMMLPKHSTLLPSILKEYQSSPMGGHSGEERTYKRIATDVFWIGMCGAVFKWVQ